MHDYCICATIYTCDDGLNNARAIVCTPKSENSIPGVRVQERVFLPDPLTSSTRTTPAPWSCRTLQTEVT